MSMPLDELAALTAEEYAEHYAMTYEFAANSIANTYYEERLATGKQVKVTGAAVNLRSGPGTMYDIVGQAQTSDALLLLGEGKDAGGQLWYRVWDVVGRAEVWVASWLVEVLDNYWIFPQYEEHDVVVHDCEADGLACWVTDTMRDGGTGYRNLVTDEVGLSTESRYPPSGIWVQGYMVYDNERGAWLCSGIEWDKLDEETDSE
jgi:hypothetical protein